MDKSASGTGLAFILFTGIKSSKTECKNLQNILSLEAVNQLPYSNLWAVLFFCMVKLPCIRTKVIKHIPPLQLFTLGLDSQFGTVQGVIQAAVDLKIFPETLRKEFQTGAICLILCLMSMMFAHNAGNYVFTIYDNFCGSIPLLVIALFECIGVSYFYGLQRSDLSPLNVL